MSTVEVAPPEPGPHEVVLEVAAAGVCGTDAHIIDGELPPVSYPITPGHEFSGTVTALGSRTDSPSVGDRVAVDPNLPCGACRQCRAGRGNICATWDAVGISRAGAWAEAVLVPAANCYRLPESMTAAEGAMIEPLSCAVHGLDRLPRRPADRYLVYGAGTMGLLMAQLVRGAGASEVRVVDLNTARLEFAESLGMSGTATSASALPDPTDFDVVIDATGAIPAIEDGLGRVRKGGTFLQFGVTDPNATATFSPYRVYNEEISIVGSMAVHHSFQPAVDLVAAGTVDVASLVSRSLPLDSHADAIALVRSGTGHKIQLVPGQ